MEDEIIIHRQIINHYSRPDLAPQLWNYSSTLANNNNRLYWVEKGEKDGVKERKREALKEKWKKTERRRRRKKREAERNINLRGGKWQTDREGEQKTGKISLPNSVLESRVIITALGPSIVCPGKQNPAQPISIHLYWSYCQHPGWQRARWERERERERQRVIERGMGQREVLGDQRQKGTERHSWKDESLCHFLPCIDCWINTTLYTCNASCYLCSLQR